MTSQQPDDLRGALADLDARLGRVTAEIGEIRAGLVAIGRLSTPTGPATDPPTGPQAGPQPEVQQPRAAAPPQPSSATPTPQAGPRPPVGSGPWRQPAGHPRPSGQYPQYGSVPPVRPEQPAPGPMRPDQATPRRRPKITAATVIAAIGGAVMLAGIAFLLVVAIQAGLFPPAARVAAAAVMAVLLVGLGLRLQARHEAAGARPGAAGEQRGTAGASPVNPGALALVGTGLAAGILDVIASTTLYQWIPVPAAYMFVGAIAIAGMALAQRWTSGLLACLVAAGTMLLAPLISTGVELPIFLAIVGVAAAVLTGGLGTAVRVVWSVLPAFMLTGYLSQGSTTGRGDLVALIVTALAFAAVGVGTAWYDSVRRSPAVENAALVVVPTAVPLLVLPGLSLLSPGWPVGVALALAYLAVPVVAWRSASRAGAAAPAGAVLLGAVAGCVGTVLLLVAWLQLGGADRASLAVTLSAIAYAVAAGLTSRRWLDWVAGLLAALAVATYVVVGTPFVALSERLAVQHMSYWHVVSALAVTALACAVTWWATRRLDADSARVVMAGAVVGLLTLSVMIVAAGVVIGDLAGAARTGFLGAHLVVTVLWICCAAWLVLTASPRIADARRLGFVLGALALAKLLLLDLATLPGLFRVLSFIVVGAVMLAVAVRYRNETDPSGSGSPT